MKNNLTRHSTLTGDSCISVLRPRPYDIQGGGGGGGVGFFLKKLPKWVKKKFSGHPLENKYFIAVPAPYTYMVYMEKKIIARRAKITIYPARSTIFFLLIAKSRERNIIFGTQKPTPTLIIKWPVPECKKSVATAGELTINTHAKS